MGSALNISYAYSATQNNGKITSETDALSGEQVLYTYDSLNRLASAQTAGAGGWGQSYTYDGFGNLTDQTLIKGTAPDVHVAYNYLTNRQTGDTADANGNIGSTNVYDIDNRLVQPSSGAAGLYAYDPSNKRVWRWNASGLDELTFWARQKLATYQISVDGGGVWFTLTSTNVNFGGKLVSKGTYNSSGTGDKVSLTPVVADRLGSIGKFYPYGVERPSATQNDKEKFTGYFRDASTGLDYADQRYHQPGMGRFMTPDQSDGSANPNDPGSWNEYAYTRGDPINRIDPEGLADFSVTGYCINCRDGDIFPGFGGLFGGGGTSSRSPREIREPTSSHPECNKPDARSIDQMLDRIINNSSDVEVVAAQTGIPAAWLFGWAASETGFISGIATTNNNFFNLTTAGSRDTLSWGVGTTLCSAGSVPGYACFGSFGASALAALTSSNNALRYQFSGDSTITTGVSVLSIITDQRAQGASLADIFQAVANAGFDPIGSKTNAGYGGRVSNTVKSYQKAMDCLQKYGYI